MKHRPIAYRRARRPLAGLLLIIIGSVLLLERTGIIDHRMVAQWWPLLLIVTGGWLVTARTLRFTRMPQD
jgi:hypothetical protein